MSTGTGCLLYRRAFCLVWKAWYYFQLQTPETAACLKQIQPKGGERDLSRILSSCQSIPLCGIIVLKCQQELGIHRHYLQSESLWSSGSVLHAAAF